MTFLRVVLLLALMLAATETTLSVRPAPGGGEPGDSEAPSRAARKELLERGLLAAVGPVGMEPMDITVRMRELRVPALAVAVVDQGRIDWADGYGQGVTSDTLFQAASISKTVAALTALRLAAANRLDLDREVAFPGVTVAALLQHVAGTNVPGFPGYASGAALPTLDQILAGEPPASTERVKAASAADGNGPRPFAYSGGGTMLAQRAMETATGRPFASLAAEWVLSPLCMRASTFLQPLPPERAREAAQGHDLDGRALPGGWRVYPELAAAGLWTTAHDLAQIVLAVNALAAPSASGAAVAPFLPAVLAERMLRSTVPAQCLEAGLGVFALNAGGEVYYLHWGVNAGYRALFVCRPARGQGVAVLAAGDNGEALIAEVVRGVAALQGWPGFAPVSLAAVSLAPQKRDALAGEYAAEDLATLEILQNGGTLLIRTRPDVAPAALFTGDGREFFFADLLGTARLVLSADEAVLEECPGNRKVFRRVTGTR